MTALYLRQQERLERYRRGWTDKQLARAEGITVAGVQAWRLKRGLPINRPVEPRRPRPRPKVIREFVSDLIRAADRLAEPPKAEQIGRYMSAWRDQKGYERSGCGEG